MAKRGRKRKNRNTQRTPSGQYSRAKLQPVTFDKGTERTQARQAQFGNHGCDAIGRAYMAGLLGPRDSQNAIAMLDTARSLAKVYRRAYENAAYKPAIADKTGGSVIELDHERIRRQEENLRETLQFVARMGRGVRLAFDSLVLDDHPDHGPVWLDSLIWAKAHGKEPHPTAAAFLQRALDPLDILANGA